MAMEKVTFRLVHLILVMLIIYAVGYGVCYMIYAIPLGWTIKVWDEGYMQGFLTFVIAWAILVCVATIICIVKIIENKD